LTCKFVVAPTVGLSKINETIKNYLKLCTLSHYPRCWIVDYLIIRWFVLLIVVWIGVVIIYNERVGW